MSKLVLDIGMYDGSDTAYYLDMGYRVVAVEANPKLVERAKQFFSAYLANGSLSIIQVALSDSISNVELYLSRQDLGSSTIRPNVIAEKDLGGIVSVTTVTMDTLIQEYGRPYFVKCDIEGADRFCVLALTSDTAPNYLSFEIGHDFYELLEHLSEIGFNQFRIIDQLDFKEIACYFHPARRILNRALTAISRLTLDSHLVRIRGRTFVRAHSAGPMPGSVPGKWWTYDETLKRWDRFTRKRPKDRWFAWYDLHAWRKISEPIRKLTH